MHCGIQAIYTNSRCVTWTLCGWREIDSAGFSRRSRTNFFVGPTSNDVEWPHCSRKHKKTYSSVNVYSRPVETTRLQRTYEGSQQLPSTSSSTVTTTWSTIFFNSTIKGAPGLDKRRDEADFGCRSSWEIDFWTFRGRGSRIKLSEMRKVYVSCFHIRLVPGCLRWSQVHLRHFIQTVTSLTKYRSGARAPVYQWDTTKYIGTLKDIKIIKQRTKNKGSHLSRRQILRGIPKLNLLKA